MSVTAAACRRDSAVPRPAVAQRGGPAHISGFRCEGVYSKALFHRARYISRARQIGSSTSTPNEEQTLDVSRSAVCTLALHIAHDFKAWSFDSDPDQPQMTRRRKLRTGAPTAQGDSLNSFRITPGQCDTGAALQQWGNVLLDFSWSRSDMPVLCHALSQCPVTLLSRSTGRVLPA